MSFGRTVGGALGWRRIIARTGGGAGRRRGGRTETGEAGRVLAAMAGDAVR